MTTRPTTLVSPWVSSSGAAAALQRLFPWWKQAGRWRQLFHDV